jgi:hypothetical protein
LIKPIVVRDTIVYLSINIPFSELKNSTFVSDLQITISDQPGRYAIIVDLLIDRQEK